MEHEAKTQTGQTTDNKSNTQYKHIYTIQFFFGLDYFADELANTQKPWYRLVKISF